MSLSRAISTSGLHADDFVVFEPNIIPFGLCSYTQADNSVVVATDSSECHGSHWTLIIDHVVW